MGVVYRAIDRTRGVPVALKTLNRADPARIYRLKQEFRALADIVHPNLVTLYELLMEREQLFFIMELVEGVNYLQYVRGHTGADSTTGSPTLSVDGPSSEPSVISPEAVTSIDPVDLRFDLLRASFAQLVRGLAALHEAGKVHCDIKPSNVLVDRKGRVVLLDFGLVTELSDIPRNLDVGGTPNYMAPEQVAGRQLSPASDFYAAGVMLYECLTGRLPVAPGTPRTEDLELVPVTSWNPRVPADLARLAMELLRYHPEARPSHADLESFFHAGTTRSPVSRAGKSASFVGRTAELASLQEAFKATRAGSVVTVRIAGTSGIGKSALARHFLNALAEQEPDAAILMGRCFDRESVPYKALDGVIDNLSQFLRYLPRAEAEECMPRDIAALARLFPVLRRVDAVAGARRRSTEITDAQELRRRAFGALRELLSRLAAVRPVVIFIDDLQWGDPDSVPLIETLLREPDSPAMLFVVTYRAEETATNTMLQSAIAAIESTSHARLLRVEGLDRADARRLARMIHPDDSDVAELVAQEAHGSPFFIDALLRFKGNTRGDLHRVTLDQVIRDQTARLPAEAREILEVLAVAGRPVRFRTVCEMLEVARNPALVGALRAERLVRARGSTTGDEVETYHDRIRETVVSQLDPERLRAYHMLLARTYAAQPEADAEAVAQHYYAGGDRELSAEYAEMAADNASRGVAFERAVRLYRLALECQAVDAAKARSLYLRLGDALKYAGRGREAAENYRRAAEDTPAGVEKLNLLRMAAEQFLVSGHFEEGVATLRGVLRAVGMDLPRTVQGAVWSIMWRRAWLALRGLKFRERRLEEIAPQKLMRIDACASAVMGLALTDGIRAIAFQARHVMMVLGTGEPGRVARCLALDIGVISCGGSRTWKRTNRLRERALSLAASTGDAEARHLTAVASGIARLFNGMWAEGIDDFQRAETILPEVRTRSGEDVSSRLLCGMLCVLWLGNIADIAGRLPNLLADFHGRGNLLDETNLSLRFRHVMLLAADEAAQAEQEIRQVIGRWTRQGYYFQHYYCLVAQSEIDLYAGQPARAWRRINEQWKSLEGSQILRLQIYLLESLHLRARAALALAATGGESSRLARLALADATRMSRENSPWASGLVQLIRAAAMNLEGRKAEVGELVAEAEALLDSSQTRLYAAAARRVRGLLAGDAEMVADADRFFAAQGVRNPARMAKMLAPGFD
jgi:eukaryotic-like serine/threonine-protein kinase